MKNKAEISIIIRTFNEEKKIEECLNKILNQKIKNCFEIIIIDSGSTDKTIKIAEKYPLKIYKIKKSDFTFGKSLNLGCEKAEGSIVVSLSAHAIPLNNYWLKNLISPFKNKKIGAVYGKEIPNSNTNPMEARRIIGTFKNIEKIQNKDNFFTNSNSAFKKILWKQNKFDEKITSSEDHLWASKITKKGYFIYYQPNAPIYHSHNYSFFENYKRTRRQIYNKYILIGKKNHFYIFKKGLLNFFYSVISDIYFIFKNKYNLIWILLVIPYEIIILLAFLTKKS
jgi:glycosyltransferase involved in cell wall biosynthesis